ncbi:MAG: dihydropyrimidinase [Proteobacteria bacterium]|nr:dihydropyrimidinase [Pseudomonadota bacterium]MDA1070686.1 dihydropyrimidinase [Pseudomonadota bacterium]
MSVPLDLAIRGGTVVTAADMVRADVGVRDGKVVALAASLPDAREEIDASGLLVMPGGVDAHCHLAQPSYGGVSCADDFESGTISALCGGTTTIMPFATQARGERLRDVVDAYHARARGKAAGDYAFHLILTDPTPQVLGQDLPALIADGYTSFKLFLTYDGFHLQDNEVLNILEVAQEAGGLVMVHAENHDCIAFLAERLVRQGKTAPRYHADSRPQAVEREASHRAIALAEVAAAPLFLVHVSAGEAIEQIAWARARGLPVFAETCPQYLFLAAEDMNRPGFEGAKFMCSPPPRDRANPEILWRALQNDILQVVSSDHSPSRFEGPDGKKAHGEHAPFTEIANGIPGLETRLPLLFSEGVNGGRFDACRFVALTATNPARIYGLYPQKGTIAVGSDADLVLWDAQREVTITNADLHHNVDYTPYEGRRVTGWPVRTLLRGRTVWNDGQVLAEPGEGRFLPCGTPAPVLAQRAARP